MFSISTVASSTSMPTASARPPSVITLIVCPNALSTTSQGGRFAVAQHREQRPSRSIGAHNAGLYEVSIVHLRHILEVYGGAVDHAQRQVVHVIEQAGTAVQSDLIVAIAEFGGAGRKNQ